MFVRSFLFVCAASLAAQPLKLEPAKMPRLGTVDARFQSFNVEMVEVTGGRFWAPYKAQSAAPKPATTAGAPPGLDPSLFMQRKPIDLGNARLQKLAAALGPTYIRVSGTWANSVYFHDSSEPAPAAPPAGFGGVLTREMWKGVIDFNRAVDGKLITSFAVSGGVRDDSGNWNPAQALKLAAYTKSIGGSIAAAELFNEPNFASIGGTPKGYDAAAYGRDFKRFKSFAEKDLPEMLILGPGSIAEATLRSPMSTVKSEDMLKESGPGVGVFSYHYYGGASKRCGPGGTTPERALTDEWLSKTEKDAEFYEKLRDRFEPGKPLWLTETGETACGGNPWASTFLDTFRYVEQLGRLAKRGVQVVAHNTLAASDYAVIDEETMEPRPSYWAAVLWRRLMGTTVLDAGAAHVFAHCTPNQKGGVTVLAVNTSRDASMQIAIPVGGQMFTLTSPELQSTRALLNGVALKASASGDLPALSGKAVGAGAVELPATSITFIALPGAANPACTATP